MDPLSQRVLKRIQQDQIKPISKLYFLARGALLWIGLTLAVIFGSLASGILIAQLRQTEWTLWTHFHDSLLEFFLVAIPFVWILFLLLAFVLAYWRFRKTPRAYRVSTPKVLFVVIALPLTLGGLLQLSPLPAALDRLFRENISFYDQIERFREAVWMRPDEGRLMGTIVEVVSPTQLTFEDVRGQRWLISIEGATWRGPTSPVAGQRCRLLGRAMGPSLFEAGEVRPWPGEGRRGGPFHRFGPHGAGFPNQKSP